MKIFGILILCVLVVQTLANKSPRKRPGPPGPHRRGPPPPQRRQEAEKGAGWGSNGWGSSGGWGWNGPPAYQTTTCVDPTADVVTNYDADFLDRLRLWYWSGSTIYGYSLLARILLGRNVASQDELNQMCPAQIFSTSISTCYNFGYGRTFQQACGEGTTIVSCPINKDPTTYDGALGVSVLAGYVTQEDYLVGTDNSTYTIWYFCNDGKYADLQLATTRPYASPEAVAAFVAAAQKYGIPLNQLQLSQCDTAYSGPYPAPFQNYPNGWSNNTTGWGQPPTNGWNSPSNGWSNNGWGGHSALAEKQTDLK